MTDTRSAQAMKTAIEMEKSGHRFFTDAARQVKNEAGRKVFTRLASEELVHLQVFEKIFTALTQGTDWKKAMPTAEPAKRVPYFDDAAKQFKAGDLSVELDYLRKALELERKAISFFEKAATEAEASEAREIFKRILAEEQNHYDLIQAEIDSVNGSGFWFDVPEFFMDGRY
ncbi:MAG TPA: ferritin family protein [bacterium]|nr:ferritin family protein [bacterium]